MIEQNAISSSTIEDQARQASIQSNNRKNQQKTQLDSAQRTAQNASFSGSEYNSDSDRRTTASWMEQLSSSGLFAEQFKSIQYRA
jgi:hypothetical protein